MLLLSEWISIPSKLIASGLHVISLVISSQAHHQILLDFGLISINGIVQAM